jgi:hypothetical protein
MPKIPNLKIKVWKPKEINGEWWVYYGKKKLANGNTTYYGVRAIDIQSDNRGYATNRRQAKIYAIMKIGHEADELVHLLDEYFVEIGVADHGDSGSWRA